MVKPKEIIKFKTGVNLSVILRKKYFEFFENKLEYRIDPVRNYNVVYDQKVMIGYKGKEREVLFGVTPNPVPEWKITILKNAHRGVSIMNDHDFIVYNVVSFYWIHKWRFDYKMATMEEIVGVLGWFAQRIIDNNKSIGIKLAYISKSGEGEYDYIIREAIKHINNGDILEQFSILTNIFPKDSTSRRALKTKLVRDKWFELIDILRWDMDVNQKWLDEPILDEFNSAIQHNKDGSLLSKYRLGLYWKDGLGVTFRQRMLMWITEVISIQNIDSIEELGKATGLSMYKLKSVLGDKYNATKLELKSNRLRKLMEIAESKKQVLEISQMSRASLYRRISKDKDLKKLWDKL